MNKKDLIAAVKRVRDRGLKNNNKPKSDTLPPPRKLTSDKTTNQLNKMLDKQTKQINKLTKKLGIKTDDNMLDFGDNKTANAITRVFRSNFGKGGIFSFSYSKTLTPKERFNKDDLGSHDRKPLIVYMGKAGTGKDGRMHHYGINFHHVPQKYRRMLFNWIIKEYLINKNGRKQLDIPSDLYDVLKNSSTLKVSLDGFRRYTSQYIDGLELIPPKNYDKIFKDPYRSLYKARHFTYSSEKNKMVSGKG